MSKFLYQPLQTVSELGGTRLNKLFQHAKRIEQLNIWLKNWLQQQAASLAQDCFIAHFDQEKLFIAVTSPALANRIRFLSPTLLQELPTEFRFLQQTKCFVTDTLKKAEEENKTASWILDDSSKEIVKQLSECVENNKLKEVLKRLVN